MPFQQQLSLRLAGAWGQIQGHSKRLASSSDGRHRSLLSRPCLYLFFPVQVEILVLSGTLPLGKLSPDDGGVAHSPISLSSAKSPQCLLTAHPLFPGMLSAVKAAGLSLRGRWRRGPGAPWPRLPVFFPGPGWPICLVGQRRINQGYALHPRWCRGHVSHCSAFMTQAKHIIHVVL